MRLFQALLFCRWRHRQHMTVGRSHQIAMNNLEWRRSSLLLLLLLLHSPVDQPPPLEKKRQRPSLKIPTAKGFHEEHRKMKLHERAS